MTQQSRINKLSLFIQEEKVERFYQQSQAQYHQKQITFALNLFLFFYIQAIVLTILSNQIITISLCSLMFIITAYIRLRMRARQRFCYSFILISFCGVFAMFIRHMFVFELEFTGYQIKALAMILLYVNWFAQNWYWKALFTFVYLAAFILRYPLENHIADITAQVLYTLVAIITFYWEEKVKKLSFLEQYQQIQQLSLQQDIIDQLIPSSMLVLDLADKSEDLGMLILFSTFLSCVFAKVLGTFI